jgi:hypothetical protein
LLYAHEPELRNAGQHNAAIVSALNLAAARALAKAVAGTKGRWDSGTAVASAFSGAEIDAWVALEITDETVGVEFPAGGIVWIAGSVAEPLLPPAGG